MSENQPQPTGGWQAPAQAQPAPTTAIAYGGFWIRVVAWLIDGIALGILTSAVAPLLGAGPMVRVEGTNFEINYVSNAIGTLFGLVYFVGFWSYRGQTPGMMPFRLWVVNLEDGARPDVVRAFLRYVGLIISFAVILLGVIWVAFDSRKQGWHDKIASTLVIRR